MTNQSRTPAKRNSLMLRFISRSYGASIGLLLLTLPAVAETSNQEEPAVEFTDVYQANTLSDPAASASTQPPNTIPPAVKPPTSILVPVDPKASTAVVPSRALPPSSGASVAEASGGKEEPTREGFYLRLSYGPGYASFRGQGPNGAASISGLSSGSSFAVGGSLTRGLVLAGTLQSTSIIGKFKGGPFGDATIARTGTTVSANDRASASFLEVGLLVNCYPKPRYGLHTGLAAGLGSVSVVNLADNSSLRGAKLGGSLFVGYDWSISRYWALGLELFGSGATKASLREGRSRVDSGFEFAPVALGLAASLVYF